MLWEDIVGKRNVDVGLRGGFLKVIVRRRTGVRVMKDVDEEFGSRVGGNFRSGNSFYGF